MWIKAIKMSFFKGMTGWLWKSDCGDMEENNPGVEKRNNCYVQPTQIISLCGDGKRHEPLWMSGNMFLFQ
jgi:hypothetical protein